MNDRTELFTIGQLSRRTGLPVRTIRFWSDIGVLEPACRSTGGHRLYDTEAVVRLDLVRTLRELGLGLETVQRVLHRQVTVADVARTHAEALDAEIRILRLRRAVLRSVARRGSTTEEMRLMNELARLSAQERQRLIDDFVERTFDGIDPDAPGAHIAQAMRTMPAELPDDPSSEQVDAWIELAGLVADEDFQRRVRQMALTGAQPGPPSREYDHQKVLEHAGGAVAAGVAPDSPEGRAVLDRILDPATPAEERARLADDVETFTDRRVERYWQLMGVLSGRPPFPSATPAFEWFIAALRAHR
ncbi:DNA-binding transcriptional MerR regulator [Streptosporangium becharense]|uniref:DNA-binding transcriptional MerR regulator n=1 Tax=Streptosporangium becharense TaxID=1816182 RepID=A0A7W9IJA2_9ACTN|nr:MerR family transcriptional regulator [Streptosporangium becharense]MBB2913478.1 DNA-binding transcriptional MerR regulator [Streptosporangium becharense]MBB5821168.1 DNA-binding transcriptional MerR regulator [Streptosporangium becharense]